MTAVDNCFFCTQGLELIYHSKCNVVRVLEGKGGRKRLLIKKQRKRKIHLLGLPASNVSFWHGSSPAQFETPNRQRFQMDFLVIFPMTEVVIGRVDVITDRRSIAGMSIRKTVCKSPVVTAHNPKLFVQG